MTRATPPFFLVGNPRSGTKMLRELMNASPDLWMSDIESTFIPRYTRQLDQYGDLATRDGFDRLADALAHTRAFVLWERRGIRIDRQRWWDRCRTRTWPGILEALFRSVHEQEIPNPPKPWPEIVWGDKTPVYMAELPLLAELYPEARFIHVIRDVRDCCLSTEKLWGNSPMRTAQHWTDRIQACRAAGQELGPSRYMELRYEDLVADVKPTLGRLFDFLGVATPADAGRFLRVPENYGSARGEVQVVATNRQKWRTAMSPALRRRIEGVSGDLLAALDYEREFPDEPTRHLSSVQMAGLRLHDAWTQLRFRRREQGSWIRGLRFLLAR
ncbi:MAG TPA: sulfotransferase [Candidatus Binatia bacterium]|nr:sulfotransferase [Candidatus Binatia bacterium]